VIHITPSATSLADLGCSIDAVFSFWGPHLNQAASATEQLTTNYRYEPVYRFFSKIGRFLEDKPWLQRLALAALAGFGDLILYAVPVISVASTLGFFWQLATASSPLGWLMVEVYALLAVVFGVASRDLWRSQPALPRGVEVAEEMAPNLLAKIRRRTDQYGLPAPDRVLLTTAAEVRWIATPRRLMPGNHTYTLCIGMPLMYFLSCKEFRVLLRSAIGQWSSHHDRLNAYTRKRAADWAQYAAVYSATEHCSRVGRLLRKPVTAFAGLLEEATRSICMDQLVMQDRIALEVVPADELVDLLAAETLCAAYLQERYWPTLLLGADHSAVPNVKAFSNFNLFFQRLMSTEDVRQWIIKAQAQSLSAAEYQCGLRHRIEKLDYDRLDWKGLPESPAYQLFEDTCFSHLSQQLDEFWQKEVQLEWNERHRQFESDKRRFQLLHKKVASNTPKGKAACTYMEFAVRFLPSREAVQVIDKVYKCNRDNHMVCFDAGKLLLKAGMEAGIGAVETAMQLNKNLTEQGMTLLDAFKKQQTPSQLAAFSQPSEPATGKEKDSLTA
jgi:hypothetical protein